MYYCHADDGQITVLMTYSTTSSLIRTTKRKQGMFDRLLERYEGQDLGVPETLKLIGITPMLHDEGHELDQTSSTKSTIIQGIGSFDVRKVSTLLDPGTDL